MDRTGELSERKAALLRDLVRLFIRTGEPVGSEALSASTQLGVSSATIRNELAALEEMGYLTQPHTSAGRMPTDRGYRYFVDMLPARTRLKDPDRRAIVGFFDEALADVDEILRGTTHLLSRLTRYASLALAPTTRESPIARAEIIPVGSSVLLLVVFESGRVEKRQIELPARTKPVDIERISAALDEALRGRTLQDAKASAEASSPGGREDAAVHARVAGAIASMDEAAEAEHVFLGGVSNIATEEAFQRRDTLREMLEALERESEILRLLREAAATPPVTVTIGRENPVTGMWEASIIAAPYAAGGTIGVVGPLRMDYVSAISAVREVAERLSAAVEALGP